MDAMDYIMDGPTAAPAQPYGHGSAAQCLPRSPQPLPQLHTVLPPHSAEQARYDPVHNTWINTPPRLQHPRQLEASPRSPEMAHWRLASHPWTAASDPISNSHSAFRPNPHELGLHPSQWPRRPDYAALQASMDTPTPISPSQGSPVRNATSASSRRHETPSAFRFSPGPRPPPSGTDLPRSDYPDSASSSPWGTMRNGDPMLTQIYSDLGTSTDDARQAIALSQASARLAQRHRLAAALSSARAAGDEEDDDPNSEHESDSDPLSRPVGDRHGYDAERERFFAFARGRMAAASKRVPSKETIAGFERIRPEDLSSSDRNCIICYNDFGVQNPEGITETPIRLPKCKHVFGDRCIQKWFEENDSCPYCRDKLPSRLTISKSMFLEAMRLREQRQSLANRIRTVHQQREGYAHEYPPTSALPLNPHTADPFQSPTQFDRMRDAESILNSARSSADMDHRRRRARRLAEYERRLASTQARPVSLPTARAASTSQIPAIAATAGEVPDFVRSPWLPSLDGHASHSYTPAMPPYTAARGNVTPSDAECPMLAARGTRTAGTPVQQHRGMAYRGIDVDLHLAHMAAGGGMDHVSEPLRSHRQPGARDTNAENLSLTAAVTSPRGDPLQLHRPALTHDEFNGTNWSQ